MADYFAHWLKMGETLGENAPKIYHVNWFKTDENGKFIWPGFGENIRVLDWILSRLEGNAGGNETPIGLIHTENDIDLGDLDLPQEHLESLLSFHKADWEAEVPGIKEYFESFGDRVPEKLWEQYHQLEKNINNSES